MYVEVMRVEMLKNVKQRDSWMFHLTVQEKKAGS